MPKNILIIKLGAMGDVLRSTSLLKPLKKKYPRRCIHWLSDPASRAILKKNPEIAFLHLRSASTQKNLRRFPFELVLNMDEEPAACALFHTLRFERWIGATLDENGQRHYTPESAPYFQMGILGRDPDASLATANRLKRANTQSYQRLWGGILQLDLSRYPQDYASFLPIPARALSFARGWAREHGLTRRGAPTVGVNLGCGRRWISRQPSLTRCEEIIRAILKETEFRVLLLGGPEEKERNGKIAKNLRSHPRFTRTPTDLSLEQFFAVCRLCDSLLTTDTLAMHVAVALRKGVVTLFGPTAHQETELYGRGVHLGSPEPCACTYLPKCTQPRHCMDQIPTSAILQALRRYT
ncbi:MAG: glycosyltransferase family 9 protein [Elusimicrobia bacterium]|nr:glycosyltransferase family 9 protein [Elusimicrobiota bacterium]